MPTAFPALKPTSRGVTQGQYAVKRFVSIGGTGVSRIYSSQPFNSTLDLSFENIPDSAATSIADAYEAARGTYGALALSDEIWEGLSAELRVRLERDYTWRFAAPPQVRHVVPGIQSVTVQLEGQRDV